MSLYRTLYKKYFNFLLSKITINKTELVSQPFKTVCFFSTTAIGDTLFNTPVFRSFKRHYPDVKTIAVLNPQNASLFRDDPNLDEILLYNGKNRGFFNILKKLKEKNIDIIFILHSNEPQATPLAVLSGAKYIFKIPNDKNEWAKFHSNNKRAYGELRYVVLNRLDQLKFVGINEKDTRLSLFLNPNDYEKADEILKKHKNKKLIGFQMGTNAICTQWFYERWLELGDKILKNTNYYIILTGDKSDRNKFTEKLEKDLKSERILNLAGYFNLREAAALIDRLNILVTPDTGPLHIASALKTPTIGIFVAGNPDTSNPNFDIKIHKVIRKSKTCTPCIAKSCKFQKCMLQITADEVYILIKEILELDYNKE